MKRILIEGIISHFSNPNRYYRKDIYPIKLKSILNIKDTEKVVNDIGMWPNYSKTPLFLLNGISKKIGVEKIWYKDESTRFGIGSFKALGGAYALSKQLIKLLKKEINVNISMKSLISGKYKSKIKNFTVSCATDGNHGRSVAWGAQLLGCKCIIYLHKDVSFSREEAIAYYGAKIIRINGNYDDSVKLAALDAKKYSYIIVSDTSYLNYTDIPRNVALGYCTMLYEITVQLKGFIPTHVFIQGGVGGLASAVCSYFWQFWKDKCPRFIVVEPEKANCLQVSAIKNKITTIRGNLDTLMAGLACGEVSIVAWNIINLAVDDFITIDEFSIVDTMRLLANGNYGDISITAGESAIPGLSSLIVASTKKEYIQSLNLNSRSRVLIIGTEGATDPLLYEKLTGLNLK